jgi:hypothetical protein
MKMFNKFSFFVAVWSMTLLALTAHGQSPSATVYVKGVSCGVNDGTCFYNLEPNQSLGYEAYTNETSIPNTAAKSYTWTVQGGSYVLGNANSSAPSISWGNTANYSGGQPTKN